MPHLSQILDLGGGFDAVWNKRYNKKTRTRVRRAEKFPLEIRRTHDGSAVAAFTELNRQSVDRWAQQRGQPRWIARQIERRRDRAGQFATASVALGEMCMSWTAHRAGEPIAVYVALQYGQHSIGWMSAMHRELAVETRAGHLLQSLAIQHACHLGHRYLLMGESAPGSGVEMFKAAFGATPVQSAAVRLERLPITPADRWLRSMLTRVGDRNHSAN